MKISLATLPGIGDAIPASESSPPDYPGTWLRFGLDQDPKLPMDGEVTFRYCVRRKTVETQAEKTTVEYSLDLKELLGVAEDSKPKTKSAEEALDELFNE